MAFALSDFKKTSRKVAEDRMLYPYVIRDDRYLAAIAFAVDYFERMVGRRRAEIDPGALLEFFGDPKLARGLVACLSRTYVWRQRAVRDIVDAEPYAQLEQLELTSSIALRGLLHTFANQQYGGFLLPEDRRLALELLCHRLPLRPKQLEELLVLDAEDEAILTKVGPTPEPADVVGLYNFNSLETALRNSSKVTLKLNGPVWAIVRSAHNLARRYHLDYEIGQPPKDLFGQEVTLLWRGRKDVLGSWSRHGRRLVRALLRLLAAHPDSPIEGEAKVHLQGHTYKLALDRRSLAILGVEARRFGQGEESWEPERDARLATEWSRAAGRGKTRGWRLRRDPEPLVVDGTMLLPDFLAVRGPQRVPVFIPASAPAAVALARPLSQSPSRGLVVVPGEAVQALKGSAIPLVPYAELPDVADMVAALEVHFPRPPFEATLTRWQRLELLLAEEGFLDEARLQEVLGCGDGAELGQLLRGWADGVHAYYLPGLGLCSSERLGDVRKLLAGAA